MSFFQEPPRLGNQFDDDPLLPSWIARHIPEGHHGEIATELHHLGDLAVEYYGKQLLDRLNEPVLTQWDAWGQRIDRIDVSPLWVEAQVLAARTADIDMLAAVRARLTDAGDAEGLRIFAAFSRQERALLASFERQEASA